MARKGEVFVTKDELIEDMKRVYNENGYIDCPLYENKGQYGVYYIGKYGGMKSLVKELGLEWRSHAKLNKDELIQDIFRVYNEFGYIKKELYSEEGKHSPTAIRSHFGSFNNMLKELGFKINMHKRPTKEEVIKACKELYDKYGYLNAEIQRKHSGYSEYVISSLFGSFNNLLEEMNIKPNCKRLSEEEYIELLRNIYSKYNFLSSKIIDDESCVTYQAFAYRFSNISKMFESIGKEADYRKMRYYNPNVIIIFRQILKYYNEDIILFGKPKVEKTWKWLINPNTKQHLYVDLYIDKYNLVVEFDGKQHEENVDFFFRTEEEFEAAKRRDEIKEELVRKHGIKFMRVKFDERIDYESISKRLADLD